MRKVTNSPVVRLPAPPFALGGVVRQRALSMMLLWTVLGGAVGGITIPTRNLLGVVSGALAGIILLAPAGAVLGLAGARARPALVGALCGSVVGTLTGALASSPNIPGAISIGLLGGAMAGASLSAFVWWAQFVGRHVPLPGRNS
jgi:hypothetical protein